MPGSLQNILPYFIEFSESIILPILQRGKVRLEG